eukprot:240341-Chlamydomonas_euryale.AAC.6
MIAPAPIASACYLNPFNHARALTVTNTFLVQIQSASLSARLLVTLGAANVNVNAWSTSQVPHRCGSGAVQRQQHFSLAASTCAVASSLRHSCTFATASLHRGFATAVSADVQRAEAGDNACNWELKTPGCPDALRAKGKAVLAWFSKYRAAQHSALTAERLCSGRFRRSQAVGARAAVAATKL